MADFKKYFKIENILEGVVFENDGDDQCTKFGLVVSDLTEYYGKEKNCEDVSKLDSDTAYEILKHCYWDKFKADIIRNQDLAMFLVDSGLLNGRILIIKELQRILGINDDGIVGQVTVSNINAANAVQIYEKLYIFRKNRFDAIVVKSPSKQKYYKGWINRLNAIKVMD